MRIPLKLPVIFFKLPVIFFKFAPQNVGGGSGELEIPPGFPLSTRLAPHFPVLFFREGLGEGRGLGRKCRISVAFSQKSINFSTFGRAKVVVSSFSGHFSAGEGRGEVREILHGAGIFGGAAGVWGGKKGVKPQRGRERTQMGRVRTQMRRVRKSFGQKNPRGAGMLSGKAGLMESVRAKKSPRSRDAQREGGVDGKSSGKKIPAGRGCSTGRRESSFNPHEGSMMSRALGQESRARLQETQARLQETQARGQERWFGGSSSGEICEAGRALRAFRRVCFRGLRGG